MKNFLDIFLTSIIFTIILFIVIYPMTYFDVMPSIKWYMYYIIGLLQTIIFRLFGRMVGVKN